MTRVIPCLLKKNRALVKTINFSNPQYIGDPLNTIQIFNDLEVDEIVFLDITATNEGRNPDFEMISRVVTECFVPLAYGGGLNEVEDIRRVFSAGVEKAVICTKAVEDPSFVKRASEAFGSQSIVVSVDAKKNSAGKYEVFSCSGTRNSGLEAVEFAVQMEQMGAGEIFLNSIDRDGTMQGYDIDLVKRVSSAVGIPVVACGGAGKYSDLGEAIKKGGASAAAAGSLFVFQKENRSVLINFPNRQEIREILG